MHSPSFIAQLLLVLVGASSVPSVAHAAPTRVAISGPDEDVGSEARADVHRLLETALADSSRRGVFAAAEPAVLSASCPRPVTQACLLKAAKGAAVLRVRAQRTGDEIAVWIALIEAAGRMSEPVGFKLNLQLESSGPVDGAIRRLEYDARPPPSPDALLVTTPSTLGATSDAGPASSSNALESHASARTDWAAIGGWGSVGGLALLVGGGVVGLLGRNLNDDLTARHQSNQLTPADRANYDRLGTYNVLANTLFVSGGLVTATGLYVWGSSDSGARVGVSGNF